MTSRVRTAKSPDRIFTLGFIFVGLATLAQASSLMLVNTSIGLLVVRQFGLGPEVVGAVIGIQATCALVSRFPVGSWTDRYGSRLFAFGGAALMVVSCVAFILSMSIRAAIPIGGVPILLVLASMLSGVALSAFSTAASTYIAYTVPISRRAEAVGYYGVLQGLAQGFGAGVSIVIVDGLGFGALYAIAGVATVVAALLSLGLHQDGRPESATPMGVGFQLHRGVVAPSLAQYSVIVGTGAAFSFIPLLGISRGVTNPGLYFTAVAISSIVARLLTGRIADRRGRFAAIVPGMIVTAIGMYIVSSAATAEAFILAGVAVGMGFATAQPALQALAIDLAGQAERGTAMATFWAFTDFGVITGSFVSGQIAAVSGLGTVFVVSAVMPLVGVAGLLSWRQLSRPGSAYFEHAADPPNPP
ncbi:MAG: MFS transporter [Chloroflexi bacterium]|nr:MAG: MFS transporter [Chloroflexota bacterium]